VRSVHAWHLGLFEQIFVFGSFRMKSGQYALKIAFFGILFSFLGVLPSFSASLIKIVDWQELSDKNVSGSGRAALQIHRDLWKHAETEHFVYHFRDEKEAETIYVHAEVYYRWIKDMFGINEDPWLVKCHVYIFENKVLWQEFNKQPGERLPGAEAYTNGTELFIYREPFYLAPQRVLAHEITHIVMHRFLKGPLPLFLNEGFAEFMSYKAIAVQADGNEYNFRTIAMIPPENFIPLDELIATKKYPETQESQNFFYHESELLARYLLLNHDPKKFYSLLEKTTSGISFERALEEIYATDLETLSHKFQAYAIMASQK
jgi:hypothetical protein